MSTLLAINSFQECSQLKIRAQKNQIATTSRYTSNLLHLVLKNLSISIRITLIHGAMEMLRSSKICQLANTRSQLQRVGEVMLIRKTHLNYQ